MKKIISLVLVLVLALTAIGGTLAYFTDTQDVKNTFVMGNVKIRLDEQDINNPDERTEEGNDYDEVFMPGVEYVKDPTVTNTGSEDAYIFLDVSLNKYKSLFPVIAQNAVAVNKMTQAELNACIPADTGKFSTLTFIQWMIDNDKQNILNDWFVGINHADWQIEGFFYDVQADDVTAAGDRMIVRLAYIGGDGILSAEEEVKFMEKITVPETVTQEMMENKATGVNPFNVNGLNADGSVADGWKLDFKAYAIQEDELETVADAFTALFGDLSSNTRWYS